MFNFTEFSHFYLREDLKMLLVIFLCAYWNTDNIRVPVVWVGEVQNNIRLYKGNSALALFQFRAFQFIYHNLNQQIYTTVLDLQ
jgi:hypothetical protein